MNGGRRNVRAHSGQFWGVLGASVLLASCAQPDELGLQAGLNEGAGGVGGVPPAGPEGCAVGQMLQQKCQSCHAAVPIAGAPMPLMTWTDTQVPSKKDPSIPVYEAIRRRLRDPKKPMPPTGHLPDAELAAFDAWVGAGTPTCAPAPPPPGYVPPPPGYVPPPGTSSGGAPVGWNPPPPGAGGGTAFGTGGVPPVGGAGAPPVGAGGADPDPPPPGAIVPEQCFELRAHQGQTAGDQTPFQVRSGEYYHNFVFKTPYNVPMKGLTFDAVIDNAQVIHHFLLFQIVNGTGVDGSHTDEIGMHPNSVLVNGWAPGGDPPDMPPGVGLEMPAPGGYFELEIHYFNGTGAAAIDRSGIKICVTSQPVENTATITWLGSETIGVFPNSKGVATGTCTPSNKTGGDIHIITSVPHMHRIGSHMKTVINRKGGAPETLIDEPFMFTDQRAYDTPAVVHPGETLTTTCEFQNDTQGLVLWGPSTTQEMCYNFVFAYPAGALAHPGQSLEGAQNTCLY